MVTRKLGSRRQIDNTSTLYLESCPAASNNNREHQYQHQFLSFAPEYSSLDVNGQSQMPVDKIQFVITTNHINKPKDNYKREEGQGQGVVLGPF